MEYIEGLTLLQYIRHSVYVKGEKARYLAASVLIMIETLHKNGIVFRDLKLENVMIESHTGKLKLVDFGFSKLIKQGRTFTKCGSPAYMAPEVIMVS